MKNITFTAEDSIIEKARLRAKREKQSLNKVFQDWLSHYAQYDEKRYDYNELMESFSYVKPGRSFSRDEMNER